MMPDNIPDLENHPGEKLCFDCRAIIHDREHPKECKHEYEWGFSMQDGDRYEKCIHCGEKKHEN